MTTRVRITILETLWDTEVRSDTNPNTEEYRRSKLAQPPNGTREDETDSEPSSWAR
jgi:hypothetical protein